MVRFLTARRVAFVLPLALALVFLSTSCGGGGSGPGHKSEDEVDIVVVAFSHAGRTDVYRNQPITVTFNAPVKKSSVSDRTVQVRTGANLQTVAKGRFFVDGNVVTFDPRQDEELLRERVIINPNPFGYEALATYQILVVGPPTVKRVTNKVGDGVIAEYFSTFRTNDEYMPELIQPRFIGDVENKRDGKLAFLPAQDPDEPVAQDSRIVLVFDEPIDPATMDPGVSVIVRNETLTAQFGVEVQIPGTISTDVTATKWIFESAFGFGQGPYDISITLTPDIMDLSGNPLGNPTIIWFQTEYTPTVPNSNILTETFSSTSMWDSAATDFAKRASWNGNKPGYLVGGDITTTYHEISIKVSDPGMGLGTETQVNTPLTDSADGSHHQMLYLQEELGGEGTIVEVAWGPELNANSNGYALFASDYERVVLKLGHCSTDNLVATYADNFNVGSAIRVYDGGYTIPNSTDVGPYNTAAGITQGYYPFPALTSFFDYDGLNNLVLDVDVKTGTNWQSHRIYYGLSLSNPANGTVGNRRLYGSYQAEVGPPPSFQPPGNPEPTVYDMVFTKRRRVTEAISQFYDSHVTNANYGTPIISPPAQTGGATFVLEWEGAKPMANPNFPTQMIPDPSTYTGWVDNIDQLDGFRYIRFRFTMNANLISDTVPQINSITIPYIF